VFSKAGTRSIKIFNSTSTSATATNLFTKIPRIIIGLL
jgi:hypothetical protein